MDTEAFLMNSEALVLDTPTTKEEDNLLEKILSSYLGPRIVLGVLAAMHRT